MMATYIPGALAALCVLLATFILAGIGAGSGADEIRRGEDVSHLWETRTRGAAVGGYVLCSYCLLLYFKLSTGAWHWYLWLAPVAAGGAAACLFGLRFDIRLNLRRLLDRFYVGTDPETAATDKAIRARGMSGRTFAWLKLLGTVVGAVLAVLLSGCSDKTLPPRVKEPVSVVAVKIPSPKTAPDTLKADSASSSVKAPHYERRLFGLLPAKKAPEKTLEGFSGGKFKNKGTIIYQVGTGNTAAQATKPGTMATGTEATAVDAGKAKAPVQTGTGNDATDNTKAGQRGGAAATAPNSSATNSTKKGGTPWWVFALVLGLGGVGGWWVRGKASVWSWWPVGGRPG
ncbi:hypothetical protein D0N36_19255 [Hymenobacter lapidiphilus]|uniref:hypothetical protein n=1 Tax=Hymenobacter sp. CCM 8763 TaxID=2303334 RepID=UPI000E34A371|nr:hypothetical protein [Hymenobacter sp. CCM 8763]RFP63479.1 hypothetical protein D0N36_19255 [Hymenobacter sp. CCM 8763]